MEKKPLQYSFLEGARMPESSTSFWGKGQIPVLLKSIEDLPLNWMGTGLGTKYVF